MEFIKTFNMNIKWLRPGIGEDAFQTGWQANQKQILEGVNHAPWKKYKKNILLLDVDEQVGPDPDVYTCVMMWVTPKYAKKYFRGTSCCEDCASGKLKISLKNYKEAREKGKRHLALVFEKTTHGLMWDVNETTSQANPDQVTDHEEVTSDQEVDHEFDKITENQIEFGEEMNQLCQTFRTNMIQLKDEGDVDDSMVLVGQIYQDSFSPFPNYLTLNIEPDWCETEKVLPCNLHQLFKPPGEEVISSITTTGNAIFAYLQCVAQEKPGKYYENDFEIYYHE